jgi:cytochrome P450/NADPH-cytochrome P450 reductase
MHDIAKQLVLSWARKGPAHKIDAPADFTRLTLDTIALCAMEYRFNSFYHEGQHPFVEAMTTVLTEAGRQGSRLPVVSRFSGAAARVKASKEVQERIAGEIVEGRRKNPSDRKDLLNAMINGRDPKTGQSMPDDLITANMITFLIAGTFEILITWKIRC